ncbi:neuroligin-4, Y-linked isoform X2 [Magallana gigas]|uniref:neuroligin-4, Y-linked isoform X2 n=1 Tax=Magallana gigas TaxID=29159 RepID=UPI00333FE7D9
MSHIHALVLFVLLCGVSLVVSTFVTTETHAGVVRGYRVSTPSNGQLEIYLGIPFAEPPVGDLRFAPPVEKKHWRPQVLNATEFGAVCPQNIKYIRTHFGNGYTKINEDCLYLNIYASKNINHPAELLPVMVWIHGGYYEASSGSAYDGRILASRGEVIVVTVNYRLGALGFLSTFDSMATGNQALLDQVLALKWVQKNIRSFGGDPDRVTIFGESAGGAAVSLHMFSPLSEGLFHGLITQSGCALSPFAIYRPPYSQLSNTRSVALSLGCPATSSRAMIECLRTKSAQEIVEVKPVVHYPKLSLAFAPRVDGYFLHDVPENLLKRGEFHNNIRVMTGFVDDEASIFIPSIFDKSGGYDVHFYEALLDELSSGFLHREKVQSALICLYPPAINNSRKNVETYMQLASDYEFRFPTIHMSADLTSKGVLTWMYQFDYLSAHTPEPEWKELPIRLL